MIRVTVTLHSAITGEATELARMDICNSGDSTNPRVGDYRAVSYVGRSSKALDAGRVSKQASILGWRRLDFHVWNLVALALREMGYTQGQGPRGLG